MKIIEAVKSNEYLTDEEKADVIQRIERIANSPEESIKCEFESDKDDIGYVFFWAQTKDGGDYWKNILEIMEGRRS